MNHYLNILKSQKLGRAPLPNVTKKPFEPYEPDVGRAFSKSKAPSEPFEPTQGRPFSEIDSPPAIGVDTMPIKDVLVREFMEIDGLSLEEATALAAVSIKPRPAGEWLSMIAELDMLIDQYSTSYRLSSEANARVMAIRGRQSLASIPETLQWFRDELGIRDDARRDWT